MVLPVAPLGLAAARKGFAAAPGSAGVAHPDGLRRGPFAGAPGAIAGALAARVGPIGRCGHPED